MTGVDLIKAHSWTPGRAIENETNFVVQLIHFKKKTKQQVFLKEITRK